MLAASTADEFGQRLVGPDRAVDVRLAAGGLDTIELESSITPRMPPREMPSLTQSCTRSDGFCPEAMVLIR
jgi:hypothetical protein